MSSLSFKIISIAGVIICALIAIFIYLKIKEASVVKPPEIKKEINKIELSFDKKLVIDSETKEEIFNIDKTKKYLRGSGYEFDPNTFQATNAKYAGECFGEAALSNTKKMAVFSTGCLPGELSQEWIGIYTLPPDHETETYAPLRFLVGGGGGKFAWSSDDRIITYEAVSSLSGAAEARKIDVRSGDILERKLADDKIEASDTSKWEKYKNEKYGFWLKYPIDWKIAENDSLGNFSINKNNCHFNISNITPDDYLRAIEYADGKKETGCTLLFWWQTNNGGFEMEHLQKISCSTKLNSVYYGGYYFQNGGDFLKISMWDKNDNYFDPNPAPSFDSSDCSTYLNSIASTFGIGKKEVSESFEPESFDSKKIISDGDIYKLLKEFGTNSAPVYATDDNILLDALASKENLKEKLTIVEENFNKAKAAAGGSRETARGILNVWTKICAAKGIIYNDLKHACGLGDNSYIVLDDIDNISVSESVLPYFLAGYANYRDGDYNRARYFLDQVKMHRRAGVMRWGESYFNFGVYAKIYNKTMDTPYRR